MKTPAPGETPAPTATATPPRADPTTAARLRYEGETEAAIDAYAAVAEQSGGDERQAARLALAQLQRADDRPDDAAATAAQYLQDTPQGESPGAPIALLRADALAASGDDGAALAAYEAYAAANPQMAPFADASRALILARSGRVDEAGALGDAVVSSDAFEEGFLYDLAEAFEQGGAKAQALDWYARAVDAYGSPGGLSRRGTLLREAGDPSWVGEYTSLIKVAPSSPLAVEALAILDEAAVPVGPYERGFVLYRAFRNDEARAAFEQAVAEDYAAASATYYLGALDERAGDFASAIDRYGAAYALDPDVPTADDALWWRGKLLEAAGRHREAADDFATLAADYPSSEFAADAAFQHGLALLRDGDTGAAASAWSAIAATADGHERARALFWQARADSSPRDAIAAELASEHAGDYYALIAAVEAGTNDDSADKPEFTLGIDWDAIGTFVASLAPDASSTPVATTTPVGLPDTIDERMAIARQLDEAGRTGRADRLYSEILGDRGSEPEALFLIAREAAAEGRTSLSARAATLLLTSLPADASPPDDLVRAAYPPAYADLVLDAAREQKIDPLLLMALMRQESFYDPRAGSSAGALGLTQVIAPTGEAIAADLGIADFALTDLFRPRLSLRFGASYLADQLDAFDGNAYHALAAYNGGPGAASKAIDIAGDDDVVLFTEDLEFEETRRYVRLVMEHYARYRQAYLGLDAPSLPD